MIDNEPVRMPAAIGGRVKKLKSTRSGVRVVMPGVKRVDVVGRTVTFVGISL